VTKDKKMGQKGDKKPYKKVEKHSEEVDEDLERDREKYADLLEKLKTKHHGIHGYRFFEDLEAHQPGDRIYFRSKLDQYVNTEGVAWRACAPVVSQIRELLLRNEPDVRKKRNEEKKRR
jgi:hypothetical protein